MVDWVIGAAREAGADPVVVVASPETRDAFERRRGRRAGAAARHRRRGRARARERTRGLRRARARARRGARRCSPPSCSPRSSTSTSGGCRGHGPVLRRPTGRCRTAGSSATPKGASRRSSRRRTRRRAARDPRAELVDLRLRGGAAVGGARAARPAQRPGRALPHRHDRAHRRGRRPRRCTSRPTPLEASGSTRAWSSRSRARSCATGSTRRTCSRASRSSTRRRTWIDAEGRARGRRDVHPFTVLRGTTRVAAGAEVGPHVVAVDAAIGEGALVGPFCYLRPGTVLEPGREGGHIRGDEEFAYRRADQGAPPLLHRRRRHRRGHERRRRQRHGELLASPWAAEREDEDRQERQDRGGQYVRCSGHGWRRCLGFGRDGRHRRRSAGIARWVRAEAGNQGRMGLRGGSAENMATTELAAARPRGCDRARAAGAGALARARSAEAPDGLLRTLPSRSRAEHRREAGGRARRHRAGDVRERRDVLPLRRVDPRRRRLPRPDRLRAGGQEPDGAAGDDPGGEARLREADHRRRAAGSRTRARTARRSRASRSPRASSPTCSSSPAPTAC